VVGHISLSHNTTAALIGVEKSRFGPAFGLYTLAALLAPSIVAFTIIVMKPTNDKLLALAASNAKITGASIEGHVSSQKVESAHALIDKWSTLNLVRGILMTASSILGSLAALNAA